MKYRTLRKYAASVVIGTGAFLIASCGPPSAPYEELPDTGAVLEGKITYKGEPVTAGMLLIKAAAGGGTTGSVNGDGTYSVPRVPLGDIMIGINTAAAAAQARGSAMGQAAMAKDKKIAPPKVIDVPGKYANPETSGLKTTIKSGTNTFDIIMD